jgi:signal transduction histidine kinase
MHQDDSQNHKLQILGKLNASFFHEIRNPLFALKLNHDYLSMLNIDFPDDVRESLKVCNEAVQRMNMLVDNILNFSRKQVKSPVYCPLNSISSQVIELANSYAGVTHCEIKTDFHENAALVFFDKNQLLQVMLNLITNAIDASPKSSNIIVRTYSKDGFPVWEVEDFGTGIRDEDKSKIFKDFFTSKNHGTGLGLGICKNILSEHKAVLDFYSEYGKGSRFFISFSEFKHL